MKIVFCNDNLSTRTVDSCYESEAIAASEVGLSFELIDFSAVRQREMHSSTRLVTESSELETAIYRGWMLNPDEYKLMYDALYRRNIRLINSPEQYSHCHWLHNSYPIIEGYTPQTVWMPLENKSLDMQDISKLLKQFSSAPVIVKDYVKSRKHEWNEACFIPDTSDVEKVTKVVNRFIELQGELEGGLVFREFVNFEPIGIHPKSGMPLTLEYRLFVLEDTVIVESPYWDGQSDLDRPPVNLFQDVLGNIQSNFFTCDIARTTEGHWLIVELGDGQVAGLPEQCELKAFYDAIAKRMRKH